MHIFGVGVELGVGTELDGMSIFPLIGSTRRSVPYVLAAEAIGTGLVEIEELSVPYVSSLQVNNLSSLPVLFVEGELLIGVNQDRIMNVTVLCPPRARTVVPVSCVEEGRWRPRGRGSVEAKSRLGPGTLRAAKIAGLALRGEDPTSRESDQDTVWQVVRRQRARHGLLVSGTGALDDVQELVEERIGEELDRLGALAGQVGVVCTAGDRILGLDLFDDPETMETYLRPIVAGHALDAASPTAEVDPLEAVRHFLTLANDCVVEFGEGVGLGHEVLLRGAMVGIGLEYEGTLVHLSAFPADPDITA